MFKKIVNPSILIRMCLNCSEVRFLNVKFYLPRRSISNNQYCLKAIHFHTLLGSSVTNTLSDSANLQELQGEERRQQEEIKAHKEEIKQRCVEKQEKVEQAR